MNLAAISAQVPSLLPYFRGLPRFFDFSFGAIVYTTVLERNLERKRNEAPRCLPMGLNNPSFPNQLSQTTVTATPTK